MPNRNLYILALLLAVGLVIPDSSESAVFPGDEWTTKSASDLDIDQGKVDRLFDLSFEDDATQAVVLIKDGYLIGERYAEGFNADSFGTSWSMAKSFYASLIGISIDRGEIKSLDDKVSDYLDYFNDERSDITIRDILNMASGLQFPEHEHELMFFKKDHLAYAKDIGVEKKPNTLFEYNNVNSMLLGDILLVATGKKADELLNERILKPIGAENSTLWRDSSDNVLTYCCIDMSARDYSRFGLLFSRNGKWEQDQIISSDYVNETFTPYWEFTPERFTDLNRGYSLHWWFSKNDDEGQIFNASGKFGQYIFVDRKNDVIFTRITKYFPTTGSKQDWGILERFNVKDIERFLKISRFLEAIGLLDMDDDIKTPNTRSEGESEEFYSSYPEIIDAMADLSRD
ncbi:MAG: beta-lactamase family protein [Gammaproteobacteria bacterium]|nr:beta-lactamase family protein [Gammaproteobacteria bacterium]|tara:strand:- start:540 stop:1742 length:1203 start_codon:yes stop_codon:yes gene_type:complete